MGPLDGPREMFAPHEAIGFLRLVWHRETAPGVTVVEASPCGQFDLFLCSIACLRSFMTARIDELEKVAKKERAQLPRKRRMMVGDAGLSAPDVEAILASHAGWYARQLRAKKLLTWKEEGVWTATTRGVYGLGKTKAAALADLRTAIATLRAHLAEQVNGETKHEKKGKR